MNYLVASSPLLPTKFPTISSIRQPAIKGITSSRIVKKPHEQLENPQYSLTEYFELIIFENIDEVKRSCFSFSHKR